MLLVFAPLLLFLLLVVVVPDADDGVAPPLVLDELLSFPSKAEDGTTNRAQSGERPNGHEGQQWSRASGWESTSIWGTLRRCHADADQSWTLPRWRWQQPQWQRWPSC